MAIGSASLKVAKVASVASFALLMSTGIVTTAQAAQAGSAKPASVQDNCQNVDGGTWCTGAGGFPTRACWSNYYHPNNYHSATAAIGSAVDTRYNSAGNWAQAYAQAGAAYTCYTYYNDNP
jgi:hypothetical protein